ncbi:MAG: EAL domain-containing protein, partial [Pseudomonadota bacterium]|nr:EAL domain-containing protein [Pseudomonadota bacterium]
SVAIDHFGQGFASMRHLRELPINLLKLDGTLCKDISNHPENKALVRSLLELAKHAGVKTVAKWIESKEDAELLAQLGADYLQGYHLGRPSLDQLWISENLDVSEAPQPQAELETQETEPQELPQEEPSIEIITVMSETIIEVTEVQPMPEFDAQLDFSVIDDSIAKLREALDGLSATSSAAEPDEAPDEASVHAA